MHWISEWKAISTRINALIKAGHFHAQMLAIRSSDTYGGGNELLYQAENIFGKLKIFSESTSIVLPNQAKLALDRFIGSYNTLFTDNSGTPDAKRERLKARLTMLSALEGEITFLLSDTQEQIHRRSELAFTHLQRSIVADPHIKNKWNTAFNDGELACEKLGAIHLLQHGIWAFKVNAEGGRTDLILGEPLDQFDEVQRVADGLVLTEWKLAREDATANNKFESARTQASRYATGILAGLELASYRYAVVITKNIVDTLSDKQVDGVIYRHINIAVEPRSPSRQ